MENKTKRLTGLAKIVAGAGLAGLMAILPASQVSCTNTKVEQSATYNFAQELKRENPEKFEKFYENNGKTYYDSSLKFGNGLIIGKFPESGKGRFIDVSKDGRINAGYWGDNNKVVAFLYEPKNDEIIISEGNKIVYFKKTNSVWEKGVYAGNIPEGIKFEDISFEKSKAPEGEAEKWIKLAKELAKRYK